MELSATLRKKSDDPKKSSMLTAIAGGKLKKAVGSSEDLRAEMKSKSKERSAMTRFDAIDRIQKFQNHI